MIVSENYIRTLLAEEMTKGEISALIASKLGDKLDSREFKRKVREIAADVVNEIFKLLWQRNSFWKSASVNG